MSYIDNSIDAYDIVSGHIIHDHGSNFTTVPYGTRSAKRLRRYRIIKQRGDFVRNVIKEIRSKKSQEVSDNISPQSINNIYINMDELRKEAHYKFPHFHRYVNKSSGMNSTGPFNIVDEE